jgi:hypothetical protein
MTEREALKQLGIPEPDVFETMKTTTEQLNTWQEWNDRRIEALKIARAL